MASHNFTRQELYDLVWSEPMIKLAARYGISGNGLAKACRRADIPVPERGYWARKEAGQKVTQPPLPALKADTPAQITIQPPGKKPEPPAPPPVPLSVQEKIEAAKQSGKPIVVPATLSNPHRIIAAWMQQDRQERRENRHNPYLGNWRKPIDNTDLNKRQLRILSALFKALEERGYKVSAGSSAYICPVQISLGNETLSVQIDERIRQVRRELTNEDRKKLFYSAEQKWTQEKVPTGELILKIIAANTHGITKEWRDTPEELLENRLDEVPPQIAGMFEEIRLRRLRETEERDRQWKIAEERHRVEMERKRETVRFRKLISYCDDWRTAADIRALVAAVEKSPLASAKAENFSVWKSWALGHAQKLDPLENESLFNRTVSDYETYALRD